jgi:hypothetical protein
MVLVLILAAVVWPAVSAGAHAGTAAAAAAGSLEADFNNDGFADLAIGAPFEDIGVTPDAGAVNVLYGAAAGGLSGAGDQQFWQGAGGVAGIAEDFDAFGWALVGSDQPTGPTAASSSSSQSKTPDMTPSWTAEPKARPVDPTHYAPVPRG